MEGLRTNQAEEGCTSRAGSTAPQPHGSTKQHGAARGSTGQHSTTHHRSMYFSGPNHRPGLFSTKSGKSLRVRMNRPDDSVACKGARAAGSGPAPQLFQHGCASCCVGAKRETTIASTYIRSGGMQRGGNAPTRARRRAPLHGHGHALAHNQLRDEDRTEHGTWGINESSRGERFTVFATHPRERLQKRPRQLER